MKKAPLGGLVGNLGYCRLCGNRLDGLRLGHSAFPPIGEIGMHHAVRPAANTLAAVHDQVMIAAAIQRPAAVVGREIEQSLHLQAPYEKAPQRGLGGKRHARRTREDK